MMHGVQQHSYSGSSAMMSSAPATPSSSPSPYTSRGGRPLMRKKRKPGEQQRPDPRGAPGRPHSNSSAHRRTFADNHNKKPMVNTNYTTFPSSSSSSRSQHHQYNNSTYTSPQPPLPPNIFRHGGRGGAPTYGRNSNFNINCTRRQQQQQVPTILVHTVAQCQAAVNKLSTSTHIAVDCEGVLLSRTGKLCLIQIANEEIVIIFDLVDSPQDGGMHGKSLFENGGLKKLLEDEAIYKVMHDCRHDSDALYHQFNIKLSSVIDTQVAFFILRRSMKMEDGLPVSLKTLLKKFSFVNDHDIQVKNNVKDSMKGDNEFWLLRPLSDTALWYARLDVEHLLRLSSILGKLIQSSDATAWSQVISESQVYVDVFRGDLYGPRKAELEFEMKARVARRQRIADKNAKKALKHHHTDPMHFFTFDHASVVDTFLE